MLFKSHLLSQASGSVAGNVFSRNQGGMYIRARTLPVNPNTEAQQAVRSAMAQCVVWWQTLLTQAERDNWNTYAFNTPTLNKLGESTHKTGQQMFLRGNIPRIQAGLEPVTNGPPIFNVGDFTPPTNVVADASASTISISWGTGDEWASENGSVMLIYQSRPQAPTRNFGKGPYQLLTFIAGTLGVPGVSPKVATSLFPMAVGQRIFLRVTVSRADGRLSGAATSSWLVTP